MIRSEKHGGLGRETGRTDASIRPASGTVEVWTELTEVALPLVRFRQHFTFLGDGTTLESSSTLRFRGQSEIAALLREEGFDVDDVRGAPDRPGLELVFIATRAYTECPVCGWSAPCR